MSQVLKYQECLEQILEWLILSEMLGKASQKSKKKKMTVKDSYEILIAEESDKMIEQEKIIQAAKVSTENNGIVFLDEIDKVSARGDTNGGRCF